MEDYRFRRGDIFETREGVCRLGPPLAREVARLMRPLSQPLSEYVREVSARLTPTEAPKVGKRRNSRVAGKGGTRRLAPPS